eukprot:7377011-Prymnesium_polylepis.3
MAAVKHASARAALSSPCCAWPFGAVRLALRPSCLTAVPSTPSAPSLSSHCSALALHASPRE